MTSAPNAAADAFAVYIHWPFCRSKCPYCDFNSHVQDAIDEARWAQALIGDVESLADETPGRTVDSVFFGGGTPSLMAPATVAALIDTVAKRWTLAADAEITLEANPTSVEAGRFRDLRTAGVNRLSLGVQALDDAALRFLGRTHGAAEARHALALAAAVFPRTSFDLIYGRPGQTVAAWRAELAQALALAGEHLSLYQLTIEPGTPFHRSGVPEAGDDRAAALYDVTGASLDAAGLPAYEISNHARPGGACRHNVAIWRGGDYGGVGPGAHGRIRRDDRWQAIHRIASPADWLAAVEANGNGVAERTRLTPEERRAELLLCGLRLTDGIDRTRFLALTGQTPEDAVDRNALNDLAADGFVIVDDVRMRVTAKGRLVLNALLGRLLT